MVVAHLDTLIILKISSMFPGIILISLPSVLTNSISFQAKFNTFVLNLRNEYSNKVTTFRQVITIHREDTLRSNTYWEDTVKVWFLTCM